MNATFDCEVDGALRQPLSLLFNVLSNLYSSYIEFDGIILTYNSVSSPFARDRLAMNATIVHKVDGALRLPFSCRLICPLTRPFIRFSSTVLFPRTM